MDNWIRNIEYSKYDSDIFNRKNLDIRNEKEIEEGIFKISFFQLAISTAKSILTRSHKYSLETAAFARSYFQTIPFLLNGKDGFLTINYDNKDILRDFSKSTRHGEIAQGINYAFAKSVLGAYSIRDFKFFAKQSCRKTKIGRIRTPDYILYYYNKKTGILESKSTMKNNPTQYLINGNKQCEEGEKYLQTNGIKVFNTYTSAVSFATSSPNMSRHTHIYLADPENRECFHDENPEMNKLYEYSKWFYLAGNKTATEKLIMGKRLSESDFSTLDQRMSNDGLVISSWNLESPLYNRSIRINLGIKPSLQEYLINGEIKEDYESIVEEEKEIFEDGTFIIIE